MRRKGAERDTIYMVVAKNIKYYRKSRNMTQAQLAEKTEYSHEFIRRIEAPNSRKNFSLDTVSNIARALDIDIELLFEKREVETEKTTINWSFFLLLLVIIWYNINGDVMEYKSEEELFNSLRGAFNVKLRLIKDNYSYIKMIDIWNYLKLNKWIKTKNLSISEMVNDIIDVDIEKVDSFLKERIKNTKRDMIS